MATYTTPRDGSTRTSDYRFTVTDLRDFELQQLKEAAKTHNKAARALVRAGKAEVLDWRNRNDYSMPKVSLMRVHIMPRGPRAAAAKADYANPSHYSGRFGHYDSYLPQKHATHFDVYFREDTHNNWRLQEEQETGLKPGQQALISKLATEKWALDREHSDKLRAAGIVRITKDGRSTEMTIAKYKDQLRAEGLPESTIERIA